MAHINSITCFSSCHHGYSYHPTEVGEMHPGLKFNLLRAQIDACHEIDVKVPIYITAGINDMIAAKEPGWRELNFEGRYAGWQPSPIKPGFKTLCFNSPYLDYLCKYIEEAARLFPDADGMFFDIISQNQCCCPWCMESMKKQGFDPEKEYDRGVFSRQVIANYMKRTTAVARSINPDMPVFHNTGLIGPGNKDLAQYFSHMELESLPTGGWGYDHYPLTAAYCRTRNLDFMGMTGKFHTSWGEFGGFKSPAALRYECCAMLANGSKCSIGDQLHPSGMLDESTCRLIGAAYAEVETKEPWCSNVDSVTEIAIVSNAGYDGLKKDPEETAEVGVSRFLLESHIPFDRIDWDDNFANYKYLIFADDFRCHDEAAARVREFIAQGGKVILSGTSLLKKESETPAFEVPAEIGGLDMTIPNFVKIAPEFAPDGITTPFVMYRPSLNIKVNGGTSLGQVLDPYFTRSYEHFCSHQHTPNKLESTGFDAGVMTGSILYFAHPVFTLYAVYGTVILKQFINKAIKAFMGADYPVITDLPSQGRVFLTEQKAEKRFICHALFATPALRGMKTDPFMPNMRATIPIEVIDDITPVYDISFEIKVPQAVTKAELAPQGTEIPFEYSNGKVKFKLDKIDCHQMVVLNY